MSDFAEQVTGQAKYPCAVCEQPAIIFTPPDREGRRRFCGEHFDRLALETLANDRTRPLAMNPLRVHPICPECGQPVLRDGVIRDRDGTWHHLDCWNKMAERMPEKPKDERP